MYLAVRHRIKSTKQLKCTLNDSSVSLKHVHVTWVIQYGLSNPYTIESNLHMILVNEL